LSCYDELGYGELLFLINKFWWGIVWEKSGF